MIAGSSPPASGEQPFHHARFWGPVDPFAACRTTLTAPGGAIGARLPCRTRARRRAGDAQSEP